MNHAEVRSNMPDYLEGDLDLTRRALLDAHLDACEECSREFAQVRGTIALLRSLPDPVPPPFLAETVMRRIRAGEGRFTFGDRLRTWLAALATPQIAIPATALGLGLLMATGTMDPATISLDGLGAERERPQTVQLRFRRPEASELAQLPPTWSSPVVAGAPDLRIALPGGSRAQASESGGPRLVTRWPLRSVRNTAGAGPLSLPVANGPGVQTGPLYPSAFRPDASAFGSLEQRVEAVIQQPARFASDFATRSIVEQETWVRALAEHAREQGRDAEVLASLNSVPDLRARQLATAFSAELRHLGPASVMARSTAGSASSAR